MLTSRHSHLLSGQQSVKRWLVQQIFESKRFHRKLLAASGQPEPEIATV